VTKLQLVKSVLIPPGTLIRLWIHKHAKDIQQYNQQRHVYGTCIHDSSPSAVVVRGLDPSRGHPPPAAGLAPSRAELGTGDAARRWGHAEGMERGVWPRSVLNSDPAARPMPVTIAPTTRAKLLRITARDLHLPLHDSFSLEEMLTAAAVLRPSSARFWDSESESECEDLGDAEVLHPTSSSSPAPSKRTPAVVAPSATPSATVLPLARVSATSPRRSPTTPPRRAKPPWKSLWKSPLPPARSSPPATLGDFLPPALRSAEERGAAAARDADHDPCLPLVPNLEREGPVAVHLTT
jgi:hypothetical protein